MIRCIDESRLPKEDIGVKRLIELNHKYFSGEGLYYHKIKTVRDGILLPLEPIYELYVKFDYVNVTGHHNVDWFIFGSDDSEDAIKRELSVYLERACP